MRHEKFGGSLGEGKELLGPRFLPLPPVLYHSSGKSTYSEVTKGTQGLPASGIATVLCFCVDLCGPLCLHSLWNPICLSASHCDIQNSPLVL